MTHLWGAGKTSPSEKSIAKHVVKHTFCNIAKTKAVRRRELLRDKVSQGRPHPLRHNFKVLRSDSAKRFLLNFSLAILFALRSEWSGTPLVAWLSPAAAHYRLSPLPPISPVFDDLMIFIDFY